MAMTISTEGIEELGAMLARLGDKAQDVATGALFEGAGVVADAFSSAVNGIRTEPFKYAAPGKTRLPSPEEKAALVGKSGIAKFDKGGDEVNTIIGISGGAGYAQVAGKPKAVRLIARSINSGTSFMKKQPVFRKAASGSSGPAKAATVAKAEEMFKEIIGG
jgi:hypothetical protein